MYCNGPDEHYIDLACPFGKTNSALEFCPPVRLFAESAAFWYGQMVSMRTPTLGTHVDDIFGGFKHCADYREAHQFREFLINAGSVLTIIFNSKEHKTPLPARAQVILGRLFNSVTRRVNTEDKKRTKYRARIASMLNNEFTTRKDLEKIHGCLNYVAGVEPFGRPFLAHLTMAMAGKAGGDRIAISRLVRQCLEIWDAILVKNKGISLDFILRKIPQAHSNIFADASTSWGVGGCCGSSFFSIPWSDLALAEKEIIARKELLACVIAVLCFGDLVEGKHVKLYTDNKNVFHWLLKGRSSSKTGTKFLALLESSKYIRECKISPKWIPSEANRTADDLSRGKIPEWLRRRGSRRGLSSKARELLALSPTATWKNIMNFSIL